MSIERLSLLYFLAYVPYAVMTRWLASIDYVPFGRPLTGLEILPAVTILSGVLTLTFAWLSGWTRRAHHVTLLGGSWPCPTRWTLLSGIGTALLLFTVPLSFTFKGVSIPFIQLLMRGDVLVIAPLVDLMSGRKVRWYSWLALLLVAAGLTLTIRARGGLYLPPLAIVTVVLYTLGYFVRTVAHRIRYAEDRAELRLRRRLVVEPDAADHRAFGTAVRDLRVLDPDPARSA
jgi:hypothetical protein